MHSHISPFLQHSIFSSRPFSSLKGKLLLEQHNSLTPPTPLCFFESWHAQFVRPEAKGRSHGIQLSFVSLFPSLPSSLSPLLSPLNFLPNAATNGITWDLCLTWTNVHTISGLIWMPFVVYANSNYFLNVTWKNGEINGQGKWGGIPSCEITKTQKNPKCTIWKNALY